MKFSTFGQEIPCETTATRKVTVEPLIHNIGYIFASDASEIRTCAAEVSS